MTILSAMQSAAVRLLGRKPDNFFGAPAGNVFEMELADLANEAGPDIVKSHDWQVLTKVHTVAGDGSDTVFPLPDDYDRMLTRSALQDPSNWVWGYTHIGDINQFTEMQSRGFNLTPGAWIIYGGEMRFSPAPTGSAQFPYISRNFARDVTTTMTKDSFTADTDEFLLPERLLTLWLVWRWRENKKLDYTGDQETFMKAIGEYAAKDRGSRVYANNGRRSYPGTHVAWPWQLG